jgi:hypothetical protein
LDVREPIPFVDPAEQDSRCISPRPAPAHPMAADIAALASLKHDESRLAELRRYL